MASSSSSVLETTHQSPQQQQQQQQQAFEDAIHQLVTFSRPLLQAQKDELDTLFERLVELCGSNPSRWRKFLLTLIHKRYHYLSPSCREESSNQAKEQQQQQQQHQGGRSRGGGVTAGEGERLLFYSSFRFLFQKVMAASANGGSSSFEMITPTTDTNDEASSSRYIVAALRALIEVAPLAGGSRDICQLLVDMVHLVLQQTGTIDREAIQAQTTSQGRVSLSKLVRQGVIAIEEACKSSHQNTKGSNGNVVSSLLGELLQSAADTLDNDFAVIQRSRGEEGASSMQNQEQRERELPSTLHVFIPHRDRGRPKKKKKKERNSGQEQEGGQEQRSVNPFSQRQLVNSVTEILLWSRTQKASSIAAFAKIHERFVSSTSTSTTKNNENIAKEQLVVLQTVVRGLRKKLNSYARAQGFMLSNQFALNSTSASKLTFRQIGCSKSGDLAVLTHLAKKKGDSQTLKLIQLRSASGKATKFSSVREALAVPTFTTQDEHGANEIEEVERDIYISRLRATLKYLRSLVKNHEKSAVVSSMENCKSNHGLAVLITAALSNWELSETVASEHSHKESQQSMDSVSTKLFIGGVKKEMKSLDDAVGLLGTIAHETEKNVLDVPTFISADGSATTKAVMNTIDRHVQDDEVIIIVTGADLCLPNDYKKALSRRGCSMHCHDADDIGYRLRRENARKGDVTISLSWNSGDDLDLHVYVPNGEEIYFQNKHSGDGMCCLDVDMNAGGAQSLEPVENVFAGDLDKKIHAPLGRYKVMVQNYAYHGTRQHDPVPFSVFVEKNGSKETYRGKCMGTGKVSNVVVCEFDYKGRTIPFPGDEEDRAVFEASNVLNMTASSGQPLESLGQLVQVVQQHEHINMVRPLLQLDSVVPEDETDAMLLDTTEAQQPKRSVVVTSQDRTNILLAKLPARFHQIVERFFGCSSSLAETCAESIARGMVVDRIAITELERNGFPHDIVEAVKLKMAEMDVM